MRLILQHIMVFVDVSSPSYPTFHQECELHHDDYEIQKYSTSLLK